MIRQRFGPEKSLSVANTRHEASMSERVPPVNQKICRKPYCPVSANDRDRFPAAEETIR